MHLCSYALMFLCTLKLALRKICSTIVESSLQIGVFFTKRSQSQNQNTEYRRQNSELKIMYKSLFSRGLHRHHSGELLKLLLGYYQWSQGNEPNPWHGHPVRLRSPLRIA
jgi:hypothetical protein